MDLEIEYQRLNAELAGLGKAELIDRVLGYSGMLLSSRDGSKLYLSEIDLRWGICLEETPEPILRDWLEQRWSDEQE